MFSKTVSAIMLSLLVIGNLALAFRIQIVKADGGIIYINADGSVSPSTAEIATTDNVTYSFTDDINGSVQVNRANAVIDGNGHKLVDGELTLNADNISVSNMDIIGWDVGILVYSSFNIIRNNNVTAINTTQWNPSVGIFLHSLGLGFNDIIQNRIENSDVCIEVWSGQNDISRNQISHGEIGIIINGVWAHSNRVFENNITDNTDGVKLEGDVVPGWPYYNTFYHNNFINNTYQALDYSGQPNTFDNGYPSGGNYWSDYNGTDLYHDPYQNETGSDGIGDTPYVIVANNLDNYPLMNPWSPHDIAVTNVLPSKTVVGQGYNLNVNVPLYNLGDYTENFNVTIYANTSLIASAFVNVTLSAGASIILVCVCNTTSLAYGNYTINVCAWPVPGETNTANNNCTGCSVAVTIPGDVNGDSKVDMRDIALVARAFGSTIGSINWNANADINGDGIVNMKDIALVARNFGQHL